VSEYAVTRTGLEPRTSE